MSDVFETAAERAALSTAWGDRAVVGAITVPGLYDEPGAGALDVNATAPTFQGERSALDAAGLVVGAAIDQITTYDQRTRGPFRVVERNPVEDGAFVVLSLASST